MALRQVLVPFAVVSLCIVMAVPSRASDWIASSEKQSGQLVHRLQEIGLWVGGEVGLYDHGELSQRIYGSATTDGSQPLSFSDSYEIGSVTKSFTGILLASVLEDHPEFGIDDPLAKFLPEIGQNSYTASMTLHQLATHSAGLPDDPPNLSSLPGFDPSNPYGNISESQILDYLKSAQPVIELQDPTNPGHYLRSYSNISFAVLGMVLTRITGQSFDELLADRITTPLGMTHTFVNRKNSSLPAAFLTPFGVFKNPVSRMSSDAYAPTGAIVSTLPDMMLYLKANLMRGDTPLGRAMRMSQELGLGWDSLSEDKIIMKSGQTLGFTALIAFNPERAQGSIELSNMYSFLSDCVAALPIQTPGPASDMIAKMFTQEDFDQLVAPIPPDAAAKLVGSYTGSSSRGTDKVTIVAQDGSLVLSDQDKPLGLVLAMKHKTDPYLLYQGAIVAGILKPETDSSGNIRGFSFHQLDQTGHIVATKEFFRKGVS